jgi:hypothetical protein
MSWRSEAVRSTRPHRRGNLWGAVATVQNVTLNLRNELAVTGGTIDKASQDWPFWGALQAVQNVTLNLRNELEVTDPAKSIVAKGNWRNAEANPVMTALGIPIMAIWNDSLPLWQFHAHSLVGGYMDCTHPCRPGLPEVHGCSHPLFSRCLTSTRTYTHIHTRARAPAHAREG